MFMEQFPLNGKPKKEGAENNDVLLKHLHDALLQAFEKSESAMKLHDSITDFALGLEQKYPDARSRRLWHLLVSSTPSPDAEMNMEDYGGEDSIVRFIEGLNSEKS